MAVKPTVTVPLTDRVRCGCGSDRFLESHGVLGNLALTPMDSARHLVCATCLQAYRLTYGHQGSTLEPIGGSSASGRV